MKDAPHDYISNRSSDWDDRFEGPGYRCSARLKDGTYLPCVIIRAKKFITDLAVKRFAEEKSSNSIFAKKKDGYRDIVENFVTGGNRVNSYDIEMIEDSRFAIPLDLVNQIHGETSMGWTGWVFEMNDGSLFSYGSAFHFAFFDLPDQYTFADVKRVHNHSFVDPSGKLRSLRGDSVDWKSYHSKTILRERIFFECYLDKLE